VCCMGDARCFYAPCGNAAVGVWRRGASGDCVAHAERGNDLRRFSNKRALCLPLGCLGLRL
jgi:hypothetical protein